MAREPWQAKWGWRQRLSWEVGYRHGNAGRPYSCPWWADEQVYALALLQGKGVDLDTKKQDKLKGQ
jgi:hypothetical protein